MDWLAFIASLVESLAWPAAAVLAVVTLRRPLRMLIPYLRELRYKDFRVEFAQRLQEAEAHADVAKLPVEVEETLVAPSDAYPRTFQEYVQRIAEISPRAAVGEAWRFVENALFEIAARYDLPEPYSAPATEHFLRRHKHVPKATARLLGDLRELRNRAMHAEGFSLTPEQAREYGELAVRLTSALYASSRELESQ